MQSDDGPVASIPLEHEHASGHATDAEASEAARVLLAVWGEVGALQYATDRALTLRAVGDTPGVAKWLRIQLMLRERTKTNGQAR